MSSDAIRPRLPAERDRPGDPRPAGFLDDPPEEHIERVGAALAELAEAVTMVGPEAATPLRVCLCSVRFAPRLPFRLYGFALQPTDADGRPKDPFADGGELRFALVVNQPLDLQRESALGLLFDLVLRQVPVRAVAREEAGIQDLPGLAAAADEAAAEASGDLLRFGWTRTAQALRSRAEEAGFRLEVRYQADPFPTREEVVGRMPALRRLYNTNDTVRDAVDRTVTAVSGSEPMLRGGREDIRRFLQQNTALAGVRQFMSQAIRDADVCGNGYFATEFVASLPRSSCLKPDQVEILGPDSYRLHTEEGVSPVKAAVAHLPGLSQVRSLYGISPWEPLLFALTQGEVVRATQQMVSQWRNAGGLRERHREELDRYARIAEVIQKQTQERVAALTTFPWERFRPPANNLYFRGQELYPDALE